MILPSSSGWSASSCGPCADARPSSRYVSTGLPLASEELELSLDDLAGPGA
jgi:hypothetical protein